MIHDDAELLNCAALLQQQIRWYMGDLVLFQPSWREMEEPWSGLGLVVWNLAGLFRGWWNRQNGLKIIRLWRGFHSYVLLAVFTNIFKARISICRVPEKEQQLEEEDMWICAVSTDWNWVERRLHLCGIRSVCCLNQWSSELKMQQPLGPKVVRFKCPLLPGIIFLYLAAALAR